MTATARILPAAPALFDYEKYWAECLGPAPFLPMSREEMDQLGWDVCDIIIVTGDAYVDLPSFGMAVIGRLLEAQGFRVGIIAQPDWQSAEHFKVLGKPRLFWGITGGNMDSMINRYTADRKIRTDDAYTPNDEGGKRPDRACVVYAQRAREAFPEVPVIIGGIEASLRRIAHYDYWQDKVRRSVLMDAKADLLLYGNAERAIVEVAHRLNRGEPVQKLTNIRGTSFMRRDTPEGFFELDSTQVDTPGRIDALINPYVNTADVSACEIEKKKSLETADEDVQVVELRPSNSMASNAMKSNLTEDGAIESTVIESTVIENTVIEIPSPKSKALKNRLPPRDKTVIRLPSFERVKEDPVRYAHANRVLHLETNPGNARALVQRQGGRDVWINPPPIPLSTEEMDYVFDLPYQRKPHPSYGDAKIPAYEMIRFSVNIMRGCFGGCTFCSITEHEGRIIQNRSHDSILREIEQMKGKPGFTGVVSDLGGPTANMYRLACKSREIEAACRKPSCVYPGICENMSTDHSSLTELYRKARKLPGIKKILISSGLRYDLGVRDPEYIKELITHHVGGYLKIAPEHTEAGPLSKMMKPEIGNYDAFKEMFDRFSKEAGKEQYLIPYFIAAHPGTTDEDMMNLALWLKKNGFKADQVQAFYPSPMATATTMYHTGMNPLKKISRIYDPITGVGERVETPKGDRRRRLHKAFLRYHDPNNWPLLRETLITMGRADLIGNGKHQLIPREQPVRTCSKSAAGAYQAPRKKNSSAGGGVSIKVKPQKDRLLTQHTGLPPRADGRKKQRAGK